jgi:GAF domain-containing protein
MKPSLSRAQKYTIGFGLIGLLITVLIVYAQRKMLSTYNSNLPYIALGDNVKNRITKGHLWFEELLAGDASIAYKKDVRLLFEQSENLLRQSLTQGETEVGTFTKLTDTETISILEESVADVQGLIKAADERFDFNEKQKNTEPDSASLATETELAGGGMDQKFDAAYEEMQTTLDRLIARTQTRVKSESGFLENLSWVSAGLMVIVFFLLTYLVYRLQSGNDKMITESKAKQVQDEQRISKISEYVAEIAKGNYTTEMYLNTAEDGLAHTLSNLATTLSTNADTESKRNWATTGLAEIGQILRNNQNATQLYDNIIRFVVSYTSSNQGGLFIISDDETNPHLDLVACYAFERKKFLNKSIAIGEGLVGQCFLEGEKIFITRLPKDYIQITSGLGGANPSCVLLTPLKVNDTLYGVLELASFTTFQPHEIELVEKLSESIAATISAVRVNESTRILLERTQQQAEEMRAQEEEMRQNMEELEATQEEMRRKEKHVQEKFDTEKKRNEIIKKGREALLHLTKSEAIQRGNWEIALQQITQTVSELLGSSRVSVWLYNNQENKITCSKLYEAHTQSFSEGIELFQKDFPAYFKAMLKEDVIVAAEARTHEATAGFTESYFKPLNIYSLLDVPFFNKGKIAGVICCEHQSEVKLWQEEDIDLCKSCCDLITIAYLSRQNNALETRLAQS